MSKKDDIKGKVIQYIKKRIELMDECSTVEDCELWRSETVRLLRRFFPGQTDHVSGIANISYRRVKSLAELYSPTAKLSMNIKGWDEQFLSKTKNLSKRYLEGLIAEIEEFGLPEKITDVSTSKIV